MTPHALVPADSRLAPAPRRRRRAASVVAVAVAEVELPLVVRPVGAPPLALRARARRACALLPRPASSTSLGQQARRLPVRRAAHPRIAELTLLVRVRLGLGLGLIMALGLESLL